MSDISQRLVGAYLAMEYAQLKLITKNTTIMDMIEAIHYVRVAQTNIYFYYENSQNKLPILKSLINAIDNATSDVENVIYKGEKVDTDKLAIAFEKALKGFNEVIKDEITKINHDLITQSG